MTPGKKQRGMIEGMPKAPSRASDRLALLIKQMQRDLGPVHGADRRIAELLGIESSTVSRVPTGERGVSLPTIEKICARIRIEPDFFSAAKLKHADYRSFLDSDSPLWDVLPPSAGKSTPYAADHGSDGASVNVAEAHGQTDFEAMLTALGATESERADWAEQVQMFPLPYYNATHLLVFIAGLRKRLSRQAATDRAVTKSAESEMRAAGRRKVGEEPD